MNLWTICLCRYTSSCIFVPGKNTQHLELGCAQSEFQN